MVSMKFSNIAVLNIHGVDYRCIVTVISKSEAANLPHKVDLNKKSGA